MLGYGAQSNLDGDMISSLMEDTSNLSSEELMKKHKKMLEESQKKAKEQSDLGRMKKKVDDYFAIVVRNTRDCIPKKIALHLVSRCEEMI